MHHLHRIFSAGFGDSLRDYIRKRRLTEAAFEIIYSEKSILTIAIDYCYESQEAFSRAFLKAYNLTPGDFRKKMLYFPIRKKVDFEYINFEFNRSKEGMEPVIVHKKDFYVIGKKTEIKGVENFYKEIPRFWQKWCTELYTENINENIDKSRINGICIFNKEDQLEYFIGHKVLKLTHIQKGYELLKIEASKYALFTVSGPLIESVQKTWDYIWGIWFIKSGYTHSNKPEIEHYYIENGTNYVDIYVPIE